MIRNKLKLLQFLIFVFVLSWVICFAQDSGTTTGFCFTNNAEEELIFIKLRRTLITKVRQNEYQLAKFGIAEYYFKNNDLSDAFRDFRDYAKNYPPGESTLLARIFLYKIALIKKDVELSNSFKKEMFDTPFVLLFSKYKILKYKSAFNNNYEIHYYLDKIKVFLNGEVFEELNP